MTIYISENIKLNPKAPIVKSLVTDRLNLNPFIRILNIFFLFFLITIGLIGNQNPLNNFLNVFFWVWLWVGLSYYTILFGSIWAKINPWDSGYYFIEKIFKNSKNRKVYFNPKWIGVLIFFATIWVANIFPERESPQFLSFSLLFYSAITWLGMYYYGREKWLNSAEIFTIFFSLLSQLSILKRDASNKILKLNMPGKNLVVFNGHVSESIFIILLLAGITYDGLIETEFWNSNIELLNLYIFKNNYILINSLGLIIIFFLIFSVFLITCVFVKIKIKEPIGIFKLFNLFSTILIPIAASYYIAHYFYFLTIAGQLGIKLLSDPFGWRWNLFGTSDMPIKLGVISVETNWFIVLVSVIVGHVISILHTQIIANSYFKNYKNINTFHKPFSYLMIVYTVFSIWILSQPITK